MARRLDHSFLDEVGAESRPLLPVFAASSVSSIIIKWNGWHVSLIIHFSINLERTDVRCYGKKVKKEPLRRAAPERNKNNQTVNLDLLAAEQEEAQAAQTSQRHRRGFRIASHCQRGDSSDDNGFTHCARR